MTLNVININDLRIRDIQNSPQIVEGKGIGSFSNILSEQINANSGIGIDIGEMTYNLDVEALISEMGQDNELMFQLQSMLDSLGIDIGNESETLFARLSQIIEQYFENSKTYNADDYMAVMFYLADILAALSETSSVAVQQETPLVESVMAVNTAQSSETGNSEIDGYDVNNFENGTESGFAEVINSKTNNIPVITATEMEEARVLNILDEKYLNNNSKNEVTEINNNVPIQSTLAEQLPTDEVYVKRILGLEKLFQTPAEVIVNIDFQSNEIDKAALDMFDKMMLIAQERLGAGNVNPVQENAVLVPEDFAIFRNFTKIANNFSNKPDEMNSLLAALKGETQETQTPETLINPQDITGNIKLLQIREAFETAKVPVTTQISKEITAKMSNLPGGEIKFEMQINPEELGELKIKIIFNGSKVELEIIAERSETALLLKEHTDEMALALKRNGVEMEKYEILREPGQNSELNKDGKNQGREEQNREEKVTQFDENLTEEEMEFLEFLQVV